MFPVEVRFYCVNKQDTIVYISNLEYKSQSIELTPECANKLSKIAMLKSRDHRDITQDVKCKINTEKTKDKTIMYLLLTPRDLDIKILQHKPIAFVNKETLIIEQKVHLFTLSMDAIFMSKSPDILVPILNIYSKEYPIPEKTEYLCVQMLQDSPSSLPYCHVYTRKIEDNPFPRVKRCMQGFPISSVICEIAFFTGCFMLSPRDKWSSGYSISDFIQYNDPPIIYEM